MGGGTGGGQVQPTVHLMDDDAIAALVCANDWETQYAEIIIPVLPRGFQDYNWRSMVAQHIDGGATVDEAVLYGLEQSLHAVASQPSKEPCFGRSSGSAYGGSHDEEHHGEYDKNDEYGASGGFTFDRFDKCDNAEGGSGGGGYSGGGGAETRGARGNVGDGREGRGDGESMADDEALRMAIEASRRDHQSSGNSGSSGSSGRRGGKGGGGADGGGAGGDGGDGIGEERGFAGDYTENESNKPVRRPPPGFAQPLDVGGTGAAGAVAGGHNSHTSFTSRIVDSLPLSAGRGRGRGGGRGGGGGRAGGKGRGAVLGETVRFDGYNSSSGRAEQFGGEFEMAELYSW